jgi:two-component system, chemotaxis family, chemotaxis protein CheY
MPIYKRHNFALIAEDDPVAMALLSGYLEKNNFIVECVENGDEAVKSFNLARKEDHPFGLVCLDIEMPMMDGFSAMNKLRRIENEQTTAFRFQRSVILMVTAHSTHENAMRSFSNFECDGFLQKPIDEKYFNVLLRNNGLWSFP